MLCAYSYARYTCVENVLMGGASPSHGETLVLPPIKVLVVDDNLINQQVTVAFLDAPGNQVDMAMTGSKALKMIQKEAYDLILLDLQMPIMDGFEVTRRVRALDTPQRNVPIVAITANLMPEDSNVCIESGMDGFIAKPILREPLFAEIRRVLAKKGTASFEPTPVPEVASNLVDEQHLTIMRRDLGDEMILDLVHQLRGRLKRDLTTARETYQAGDLKTARRLVHTLKSGAGNIGAAALRDVCSNAEYAIRNDEKESVLPLIEEAEALFDSSLDAVENHVSTA